jgi:hypothetical protein
MYGIIRMKSPCMIIQEKDQNTHTQTKTKTGQRSLAMESDLFLGGGGSTGV